MRDAETTLFIIEDRGKNATSRSMLGNRHGDRQRPSSNEIPHWRAGYSETL